MPVVLCFYCDCVTGPVPDLISAWGRMQDHESEKHHEEGDP